MRFMTNKIMLCKTARTSHGVIMYIWYQMPLQLMPKPISKLWARKKATNLKLRRRPWCLAPLSEVGHRSTYSTQREAALANVNVIPLKKGVIFGGLDSDALWRWKNWAFCSNVLKSQANMRGKNQSIRKLKLCGLKKTAVTRTQAPQRWRNLDSEV